MPDNSFKYCPKCGSGHFIRYDNKQFRCKDCGFKYFLNPAAAVAAIITNDKGEVLFSIRKFNPSKGTLDLPGGFIDPNEKAEDALKREIHEELNLEVVSMDFLTSFPNDYLYDGFMYQTLDFTFVCKIKNFDTIQANDDVEAVRFVHPKNIDINAIGLKSIRNIVSYYLSTLNAENNDSR